MTDRPPQSEQCDGIDIDREFRTMRRGVLGEHGICQLLDWPGVTAAQLKVKTVSVANFENRSWSWPENPYRRVGLSAERPSQGFQITRDGVFAHAACNQAHQPGKRGNAVLFPFLQLALHERLVIVPAGGEDGGADGERQAGRQ